MLISHNPAEKHFLVMQAICLKIKIIIIKSSHIEFLNGIFLLGIWCQQDFSNIEHFSEDSIAE